MRAEYYTPGEIRFTREQMMWLILYRPEWDETAEWPREPEETGYTEPVRVQRSRSTHGYFETPAQVFSELGVRIERTGEAGETLCWEIQQGLDTYELLSPLAKRALNYISGWRRRKQGFSQWCYDQRLKSENIQKEKN